jgi:hypothetical protein
VPVPVGAFAEHPGIDENPLDVDGVVSGSVLASVSPVVSGSFPNAASTHAGKYQFASAGVQGTSYHAE